MKEFIYEDVPLFHNVEFIKTPGAAPVAVFYDMFEDEVHRFPLTRLSRDACNQMLLSRGFFKRSEPGQEVPKEYRELGTARTEL